MYVHQSLYLLVINLMFAHACMCTCTSLSVHVCTDFVYNNHVIIGSQIFQSGRKASDWFQVRGLLFVCVCVCACVCCVCVCVCVCACVRACVSMCPWHTHVCSSIIVPTCDKLNVCTCMYVYMYLFISARMH